MNADRYYSSMPVLFGLHPAFMSFATEFRAVSVRLLAYICGIAVLALIAADVFAALAMEQAEAAIPLRSHDVWTAVARPQPAFSAPVADFSSYSESYEIFRHPEGGRKDIIRWSAATADIPLAQIELYRPGAELLALKPISDVAASLAQRSADSVQTAGVIDTKFGPVALFQFAGQTSNTAHRCMGFAHSFETPRLQLSGWSCQGDTPQLQRQVIACTLDRLTMLSAGNDPKFAELFARAELRRAGCGSHAPPQTDWITATHEPQLRGSFALKRN